MVCLLYVFSYCCCIFFDWINVFIWTIKSHLIWLWYPEKKIFWLLSSAELTSLVHMLLICSYLNHHTGRAIFYLPSEWIKKAVPKGCKVKMKNVDLVKIPQSSYSIELDNKHFEIPPISVTERPNFVWYFPRRFKKRLQWNCKVIVRDNLPK